ncbi:class I adenylate-forming enzyme family protein [Sphingopyxis sp. NFH-91]|uniref:class I adenylate-forming enzyme family protein n=1 Tax=Sphingopyxis sp. NFH-91 TaxID=2744457 RepID=UPI001F4015B7|nr:AMP-binding protein [Sphingopyxis sp. NFH-91]
MLNRANALFAREANSPDKIAIRFEGGATTFAALARQVRDMAGALAALGVARGVHVGLLLPASPEFIVVEQALFALGAPITPVNILYRPAEIAHAVDCCDLAFIVTTEALASAASAALPAGCRLLLLDTVADGAAGASIPAALAASRPLVDLAVVGADDPVFHLLTSATTGKAKGVILTAGNVAANYDRTPAWLGLDANDVILCALPLYNTFGLNQCINAMLVTGATLVLLPRFDAARCIEAIAEFGCTFLPAVPTMLQKIFDHPGASGSRLQSLRRIMTGGAPVPTALLQRIIAAAPSVEVLTGYGLTEGTALVTLTEVRLNADGELERGRTIGRVLDGMELAIVDDAGNRCPAGTSGEIVVAGPNLMAGYYKAPDDTAAALRGGWLYTGDIGYIDEEGYSYIVDRKKDVIIRGGQNIYPVDIEEILYQAPGVAEVAVVGREDEMMGEVPIAFVSGTAALAADALLDHCREHLAKYKVPADIEILPELPKGPTGKILRRALRDKARHAA